MLLMRLSMGETTVENSIEVSQKLKIELWYDSANPLLGIYPKELKLDSPRGISIPIFVATLFTITNTGKQPKCPLMNEWINICYIYICKMECCVCVSSVTQLCLTLFRPHGRLPAKFLWPWGFPGKNTRAGCYFLLQGIIPIQGSNLSLLCVLQWQVDYLPLS